MMLDAVSPLCEGRREEGSPRNMKGGRVSMS